MQKQLVLELRTSASLPASDLIAATVDGPTRCTSMRSGSHGPCLTIIPESPPVKPVFSPGPLDDPPASSTLKGLDLTDMVPQDESDADTVPQDDMEPGDLLARLDSQGSPPLATVHGDGQAGRWRKALGLICVCLVSSLVMWGAATLDTSALAYSTSIQIPAKLQLLFQFRCKKPKAPKWSWDSWRRGHHRYAGFCDKEK